MMTALVNVVATIVIDGLFIYWCQIFADVVEFFMKAITSTGTKKGEVFFGDVSTQVKNNNVTADIKVDTGSNVPSQGENVTYTSPQAGAPYLQTSRSRNQCGLIQRALQQCLLSAASQGSCCYCGCCLARRLLQLLPPHKAVATTAAATCFYADAASHYKAAAACFYAPAVVLVCTSASMLLMLLLCSTPLLFYSRCC